MTEIFLIRHGETDWNAEHRLQGHLDIGLNAKGLRQAQALGQAFLDRPLDALIASDLQRASQTAQAIADVRGLSVQIEPDLRERRYGVFEGLRYADMRERYPTDYAAWQARDIDVRFPPGVNEAETLREFSVRAVGIVIRLAMSFNHRSIAMVTHGGVLDCIYRFVNGMDLQAPRNFEIRNAGINRLVWNDGVLRIEEWGTNPHLDQTVLDEVGH